MAGIPMGWIESFFAMAKDAVWQEKACFPSFVDGVIGSLGHRDFCAALDSIISLLEQSGYLARAAFALDRSLRRFGLSGWSFLPPSPPMLRRRIPAIMGRV